MRTSMWMAAITAALGAGVPAAAQTREGFQVGAELFDYGYRERVNGATIARDDGTFFGLTVAYVETLRDDWFLRVLADGGSAEVDYRNDGGARLDDVEQTIGRFELAAGRDFALGAATLTPSVGLGARVLEDESGGREASDGSVGYDREITYFYMPVGLALGAPVGRGARVAASVRYGWIVDGEARSELSQVDPELPDLRLDIDGGHMWEADVTLSLPFGRRTLFVGPFLRRWSADPSEGLTVTFPDAVVEFVEPAARATEAGVRVTFAF